MPATSSNDKYKSKINFVIRMMKILINCGWPFFRANEFIFAVFEQDVFLPRNSNEKNRYTTLDGCEWVQKQYKS